jgi:hypothetical protein
MDMSVIPEGSVSVAVTVPSVAVVPAALEIVSE